MKEHSIPHIENTRISRLNMLETETNDSRLYIIYEMYNVVCFYSLSEIPSGSKILWSCGLCRWQIKMIDIKLKYIWKIKEAVLFLFDVSYIC